MHFDVYLCMRGPTRGLRFRFCVRKAALMKHLRHNAIRELVATSSVTNQDELRRKLRPARL